MVPFPIAARAAGIVVVDGDVVDRDVCAEPPTVMVPS
jgi:hypothetical protein